MNDASWLLYPGSFVASLLGAAAGAYFKRRAEDFAAQQSIQKLTATVENIKAAISDDVWDRQRQWELRRDTVFEVVRALGELEDALNSFYSVHSRPIPESEDLKLYLMNEIRDSALNFNTCNRKFFRAMFAARLVVGKELHKALTECANEIRSISRKILSEDTAYYMRSESDASPRNKIEFNDEALMDKIMAALLSARKALEIEIRE